MRFDSKTLRLKGDSSAGRSGVLRSSPVVAVSHRRRDTCDGEHRFIFSVLCVVVIIHNLGTL